MLSATSSTSRSSVTASTSERLVEAELIALADRNGLPHRRRQRAVLRQVAGDFEAHDALLAIAERPVVSDEHAPPALAAA